MWEDRHRRPVPEIRRLSGNRCKGVPGETSLDQPFKLAAKNLQRQGERQPSPTLARSHCMLYVLCFDRYSGQPISRYHSVPEELARCVCGLSRLRAPGSQPAGTKTPPTETQRPAVFMLAMSPSQALPDALLMLVTRLRPQQLPSVEPEVKHTLAKDLERRQSLSALI